MNRLLSAVLVVSTCLSMACGSVDAPQEQEATLTQAQPLTFCLASSPAAWWRLDETSGTLAADSSGGGSNGTRIGSPTPVAGMSLQAMNFDGVDDSVQVPSTAALDVGTGDFSLSFYLRTTTTGLALLVDKRVESSGPVKGFTAFLSSGRLAVQLSTGAGWWTNYSDVTLVADGQWHHVIISVDRDQVTGLKFYVDGVLTSQHNPTPHAGSMSNTIPLTLGRRSDSPWSPGFFRGTLDEVMLFKRVISPANCVPPSWTPWVERDAPSGVGDYETLSDFLAAGYPVCSSPIGIQCRRTSDGLDWSLTGEVYTCDPATGGYCVNSSQPDGVCFNYHVRFLCPP